MALNTNPDLVNLVILPKNDKLTVRMYPSTNDTTETGGSNIIFTANKGEGVGRTSGQYVLIDGFYWLVVNLYKTYTINGIKRNYGYVREDVVDKYIPKDNAVAEANCSSMMHDLITNDKKLYAQLLKLNYLLAAAKSQGKNTASIQTQFNAIKAEYEARQNRIKASKWVEVQEWSDTVLDNIKSFFGIGLEPITMTAIGAVLIGALAMVEVYYLFKPDYETGKANLQVSKNLETALANLTPEQAQAVKNDLEKQIDTAYNQGKTDQKTTDSTTGIFGNLKTIAIVALGIVTVGYLAKNK